MNDILNKADIIINSSNNVPNNIKPIIRAICKGYIRETNGLINLNGVKKVEETVFIPVSSSDLYCYGTTKTITKENGNVSHVMNYVNFNNYIMLITMLTHEIGHIITSLDLSKTHDNNYNVIKKTLDYYTGCSFINGKLMAKAINGFRITDGFLESISEKIFISSEFRKELSSFGFDLKDYNYKDERLFPSRIYDEYKACYNLFNYLLKGKLFEFACTKFEYSEDLANFINQNRLSIVYSYLDKSNNSLEKLRIYEGKNRDSNFDLLINEYIENKRKSLELANILADNSNMLNDIEYKRLLNIYKNTIKKQTLLPISEEELKMFDELKRG